MFVKLVSGVCLSVKILLTTCHSKKSMKPFLTTSIELLSTRTNIQKKKKKKKEPTFISGEGGGIKQFLTDILIAYREAEIEEKGHFWCLPVRHCVS